MPGNKLSKKELFNRKVAKAVLAHFRDGKGEMVVTGDKMVDNLHKALVALGEPLDYRVSLELLKSFGFGTETLGLAYFADVVPKLDKVVGTIVHNTLVSVEANTAAQKAAVLLLLTQNAETYHKACASAKDAAELLNDVIDVSSTPQQTPQQTGEPAQADEDDEPAKGAEAEKGDESEKAEEGEKGDAPMEATITEAEKGDAPTVTEEAEKGDAPMETEEAEQGDAPTITEADLGGEIAKLPPLHEKVHDDMASPQAQCIVPGDDHGATAQTEGEQGDQEQGDATPQAQAPAPAQAPAQAHGRGKGTLTPPLKRKANSSGGSRGSAKRRKNNGFASTFHKGNKRKVSRRTRALRNLKDRECDESKNLKMKVVGLVKDNGKTSGLAQRKVQQLFPGYHLLAAQLQGNLLKVETYDTSKYKYGAVLYLPMEVCFSHYPGRSRHPETIYRPHCNIKAAADKPDTWIEAAGENYLYYPNSDEIDSAAKYGDKYRVPKPTLTTGVSRATVEAEADSADDQASDDDQADDSGDDQASGDGSGDSGDDEGDE
jgi:hypothetical protein